MKTNNWPCGNIISITLAVVSLHDYFVNEIRYISGPVEEKMGEDQNLQKKIFTIQTSWPAMQIR